ncbi:MAG: arsenate reductase (glutaredoxin) [Glaciecola sp.]|jgi:arsenate reductase (glutaredoxin)
MSDFILYHNPRCSKSRQTLALLEQHNIPFTTKLYLQDGLTQAEILSLKHKLKATSLLEMMRPKEAEFKTAGLAKTSSEAAFSSALQAHPKLLERPILVTPDAAAIGRPPEAVLAIL